MYTTTGASITVVPVACLRYNLLMIANKPETAVLSSL